MRRPAAALTAAVWAAGLAGPAQAVPHYKECRKLTNQIEHFEGVVEMAEERGNELWENATRDHIDRLSARRQKMCPEYMAKMEKSAAAKAAHETAEFLKAAGKIALKVFTFGAYPPF